MAVPFSNTRLRVPRGFAALLEGLAREVLRDQPEDIPAYAALYFDGLLKEREESGMDYAEWAAKLEDRFYNNHAFKAGRTSPKVSVIKEPATEKTTTSEEMSSACHTEDDASYPSTSKPSTSEHVQTSDDKEDDNVTEKDIVSTEMDHSQVESDNRLTDTDVSADEMTVSEEEKVQTITVSDEVDRAADESDSKNAGDDEKRHIESSSFSSSANVDVEERGATDDEQGQEKDIFVESEEMGDTVKDKQTSELESTEEEVSYSGLADVDVCAAELGMTEDRREEIFEKNETHAKSQEMRSSMEKSADEIADEEVLRRAQELLGEAEKTLSGDVVIDDASNVHSSEQETSTEKMEEDKREEIFEKNETHAKSQEMRSSMEKSADEIADEEVLRRAQELLGEAEKTLSGDVVIDDASNVHSSEQETSTEKMEEDKREEIFEKNETHAKSQEMSSSMEKSSDEIADEEVLRRAQEILGEASSTEKMEEVSEHSSPSQAERLEARLHEVEDLAEESLVEEDAKPGSGETQEVSPVDVDTFEGVPETDTEDEPKEEAFVEISFDDVPEIQEKQTDEECVSEVLQTKLLDVLTQGTPEELIEAGAHDTQDQKEAITEMDTAEMEVAAEAGEITDQRADTALEKIDQSDSDSDHSEKKADLIDIIPSCQVTTETESETVEANNTEALPEDSEERGIITPVELQPLDRADETDERAHEQQLSEEQENVAGGTIDSEGRGKVDSVGEEEEEEGRIIPTQTAEKADDDSPDNHRPVGSEKGTVGVDSQCISDDKDECSRPQEEEDIMDIPLDDPEANKAAAKIQAGFRGHMTRKKIKPDNKAEVEEVSSTGEDAETGGSGAVERDDTSVPEQ